jgi:hypothetical protein
MLKGFLTKKAPCLNGMYVKKDGVYTANCIHKLGRYEYLEAGYYYLNNGKVHPANCTQGTSYDESIDLLD